MNEQEAINLLDNLVGMVEDNHNSDYDKALKMGIEALEKQSFFNPKIETAVESRNVYEHGYMRGKQDGLDKADEWLREKLKRIVERLEELEEEYAYPDDDEYTAGHYSAYKDALKIVKEEGGFDV